MCVREKEKVKEREGERVCTARVGVGLCLFVPIDVPHAVVFAAWFWVLGFVFGVWGLGFGVWCVLFVVEGFRFGILGKWKGERAKRKGERSKRKGLRS